MVQMKTKKETSLFKIGNRVVYPSHGVGEITNEETQLIGGQEIRLFVISFAKERMLLRVPVHRARTTLRHLSSKDEVKEAIQVLQGRAKAARGMWSRRAQEYELKINSGSIVSIAEVLRDLRSNEGDPDRSYSERMIYEVALERLAEEIAAVENIDASQAMTKITTILRSLTKKTQEAA